MAAEGGAAWVTIHARTRTQGYAPPVDWTLIGRVRERLAIPVVANGDIWSIEGFRRCREQTGCRHFMLGRGALANPALAGQVAAELGLGRGSGHVNWDGAIDWPERLDRLAAWTREISEHEVGRVLFRMKQWLKLAATFGTFSRFDAIKRAGSVEELLANLRIAA